MSDDVMQAVEGFGALSMVTVTEYQPGWVTSVRLEFEGVFLLVEVDDDYDTIIWSVGAVEDLPSPRRSIPDDWLPLISFRVRWLWLLTNHRGFQDGLQIEFFRDRETTIIQLMAEGSGLKLYKLEAFGARRATAD